jgi:butyryl-CoA dehydrogenase
MKFNLTEEQQMVRDMVRDFAQNEIAPVIKDLEKKGEFPHDIIRKLGELNLLGIIVPEKYGGAGLDNISYSVAIEEIAKVCASTAVTLSVTNSVCCYPIMTFGTEEQKKKFLVPLASGEHLGAFSLTEPQGGSDAANQKAKAVPDGDDYILNGVKAWVTNVPAANTAVVMAVVPRGDERKISAFIVETDREGFSVGTVEDKMGLRCSKTSEIVLTDCRVPRDQLLGEEGDGLKIALHSLDASRISIGAQCVGIAQAALDLAVQYAKEREQFGKPLARLQAIQFMLSDMAMEVDAARMLVFRAADLKDRGKKMTAAASQAKLYASEIVNRVVARSLQIHGAVGYSKEFDIERLFRDARVTTIYEGTSEIQRIVIARALLS